MLYSIDIQHFLTHAIDYLTADEINNLNFIIISSKVMNGGRSRRVIKQSNLYPTIEMIDVYIEYKDKEILRKLYDDLLTPDPKDKDNRWQDNLIYTTFVDLLLKNYDLVMISDQSEYDYIKTISDYLKDNYSIETIDLNELFSKGRIGSIYIDKKEIRDKAVDIRRYSVRRMQKEKESTSDGRAELLGLMTKKEKIRKLKSLGFKVTDESDKELTKILIDEWVNDSER